MIIIVQMLIESLGQPPLGKFCKVGSEISFHASGVSLVAWGMGCVQWMGDGQLVGCVPWRGGWPGVHRPSSLISKTVVLSGSNL